MTSKTSTAKRTATSKPASVPAKRSSRPSRRAVRPSPAPRVPPAKVNKRDQLAAMLLRDEGATVNHMVVEQVYLIHIQNAAMRRRQQARLKSALGTFQRALQIQSAYDAVFGRT